MVPDRWVRPGFLLIGFTSVLGPPVVSHGFRNDVLFDESPHVITRFAFVLIVLWGAAYLATASRARACRALLAVFAAEKMAFGATWFLWWRGDMDRIRGVLERDLLAGLFFASYGPLDVLCAAFFGAVAWGGRPAASTVEPGRFPG